MMLVDVPGLFGSIAVASIPLFAGGITPMPTGKSARTSARIPSPPGGAPVGSSHVSAMLTQKLALAIEPAGWSRDRMSKPALIVAAPLLTTVWGTNHAGCSGLLPTLPFRYVVLPKLVVGFAALGVVHPIASCRRRST